MSIPKKIEYWAEGFPVILIDFPAYEDEGEFFPDVPLTSLGRAIASKVIAKPNLLTGDELAFLRAIAHLTRSEAARKLGVTRRTLINWEDRGKRPIGAPLLVHLALRVRFFGWLFPGQDLPAGALGLEAQKAKEPITIRFREEDLRWEDAGEAVEVGKIISLPALQHDRKGTAEPIPVAREQPKVA
jgi:transcriptional regulator with XRE-family HTH domain